jgi:hypothetical protein
MSPPTDDAVPSIAVPGDVACTLFRPYVLSVFIFSVDSRTLVASYCVLPSYFANWQKERESASQDEDMYVLCPGPGVPSYAYTA